MLSFALIFLVFTVEENFGASMHSEASKTLIDLSGSWKFSRADTLDWHEATVPGCVHTDLLAKGLIEDPFYRDNEHCLQWIGKADWQYRKKFSVAAEELKRENLELVCEGLDTYAQVYLNGELVLEADNMFRLWSADVKPLLAEGENTLTVHFRSPINEVLPLMASMDHQLPASNDQGEKTSPHTRKAPYHFGWDWGPRFVSSGIWRPVYIQAWDRAKITDMQLVQKSLTSKKAQLSLVLEIEATAGGPAVVELTKGGAASREIDLGVGENRAELEFEIDNPKIWWPSGMGEQNLYDFEAAVTVGGKLLDTSSLRTGLRTLELRRKGDRWGTSFEFVVNGEPVFAKGANWIPADIFTTRVTEQRYRSLLGSMAAANMNMLRVWGGGIYENRHFYEICDELGLMVWQDFMFACSMYPGDEAFLENVRQEARYQVKRLRNHPCVVLWCGNNENEDAWRNWAWKDSSPEYMWDDYRKLFDGVLPEVCAELDPSRTYWPSSPHSENYENTSSQETGDIHYWEVWHRAEDFVKYTEQYPRFMSEYGFQSFPLLETVRTFTTPDDYDIESAAMLSHQKNGRGNQLIRDYMLREYPEPKDFESFLYVSQVLQARGIKVGTEHLRRIMPRCMGALYWQANDCWPVASWSSTDYFGRWKALQYYTRRFFKDILVSPFEENGGVNVYIVSDRLGPVAATLKTTVMSYSGNVLLRKDQEVEVKPAASKIYLELAGSELPSGAARDSVFLLCELVQPDGEVVSRNILYFSEYKDAPLPAARITHEIIPGGDCLKVVLSNSGTLARDVLLGANGIEGFFEDNFFDMLPGERKEVVFSTSDGKLTPAELQKALTITSLAEAF